MSIASLTAHALSSPIEPPDVRRFSGGRRRIRKRDVVLVRVETADGEVGYAPAGASSSAMREYFEGAAHDGFAAVLEEEIGPALAGEAIERPAALGERIRSMDSLPRLVRSQAIGAVEVAIYDLLGKRQGAPVHELLREEMAADGIELDDAGPPQELPLYASAGMYMEPEGYAEQAAALRDRGFMGYKFRPGGGPERDRRSLAAIRRAVGDGMAIMVDAHTWWKLGERSYPFERVVALVSSMAEDDPYWVEEPVPPGDHDAYRRLVERTDVSIAGGESEETPAGLRRLGDTGVGFLQADVRHHEGYSGCRGIAAWCLEHDTRFVPHHFGTDLGLVANAHLVAAVPGAELLEYPVFGTGAEAMYPFPLARDILATPVTIRDGRLRVPDGPGLGVEVNEAVIEDYPYIEGPWTEFVYDGNE